MHDNCTLKKYYKSPLDTAGNIKSKLNINKTLQEETKIKKIKLQAMDTVEHKPKQFYH